MRANAVASEEDRLTDLEVIGQVCPSFMCYFDLLMATNRSRRLMRLLSIPELSRLLGHWSSLPWILLHLRCLESCNYLQPTLTPNKG